MGVPQLGWFSINHLFLQKYGYVFLKDGSEDISALYFKRQEEDEDLQLVWTVLAWLKLMEQRCTKAKKLDFTWACTSSSSDCGTRSLVRRVVLIFAFTPDTQYPCQSYERCGSGCSQTGIFAAQLRYCARQDWKHGRMVFVSRTGVTIRICLENTAAEE